MSLSSQRPLVAGLPLAGYRVLDLTRALVGPYCTMLLGDLGADVIKIERPETGDEARHWGPPFYGGESSYFLSMNRNKRSVALDLKDATGLRLCLQLAAQADIVIENFRPGVADRLGVGYEAVRAVRPNVVYCSISAYGQDGPDAWKPGYDLIMQGEAGMMSVTGHPDGPPVKAGVAETDILAGTNALAALLGALLARERAENAGSEPAAQYIDVGLLEGQVSLLGYHLVGTLLSGKLPGRMGNALPYIVPYQVFETATFEITIAVNNDQLWQHFCRAVAMPHLAADPRFATNGDRVRHRDQLLPELEALFKTQPADEWLARLEREGVPCGPINTMDRVAAHPQVQARGLVRELDHPIGPVPTTALPWRYGRPADCGAGPDAPPRPPPLLGQHTEVVLVDLLGCSPQVVVAWAGQGIVQLGSARVDGV